MTVSLRVFESVTVTLPGQVSQFPEFSQLFLELFAGPLTHPAPVCRCSVQCTAYQVQSTVYQVQRSTAYSVPSTAYGVPSTAYAVQCTKYSVHCTKYSVQCTKYLLQRTKYSVQCTKYSVQCTNYSVQCTKYSIHCAVQCECAMCHHPSLHGQDNRALPAAFISVQMSIIWGRNVRSVRAHIVVFRVERTVNCN